MTPQGGDLEPFSESVDEMFTRLGLSDPVMMAALVSEWDELAGPPWAGRSRPVFVKNKRLTVEASSASMVAFLRYDETNLVERLEGRFGDGVIVGVDIQPPGRG